ncbi:MAG: DUF3857 domain-containing protein [Gemmataceae bacterium]
MPRLLPLACLWILLAVATPPLLADDAWPIPRGPSREPLPFRHDRLRLADLPRDFLEDNVATILYAGSSYLIDRDGTVETITHELTRLNGRKGIEKLGEYRGIAYTPSYQKLTLNEARIHKASGKIVSIEPRHVHLRDVATDYQVYDPEKQLIISFPGLEVGDILEVKWTTRGKNPEHDGQFFSRYSFGDLQYPVGFDECKVQLPRDRALAFAPINTDLRPVISEANGQRLYHWKMTHRPRLPRDENLPPREELRPTIALSTFSTWDQIGRWKHRLRETCWTCTPEVRKLVASVAGSLKSPEEKARALTYWVRRNIRYVSAGEKHDYTPHLPSTVLANRFGDCKDSSQLLAVMLREAGLKVDLATLGVLDDGQVHPDVPSPWGTHAILHVTIEGKSHWIDTTATLNAWNVLPRDDLDRLCYLTDDQGKIRLLRTPPPIPEMNKVDQLTEVWIGSDGTSHCRRTTRWFGLAAASARDQFLEVPPGERRRQVTAELQDANSRTRLLQLGMIDANLRDLDAPVALSSRFEIPRHFTGTNEREGSVTDSRVWNRLLAYNIDPDRTVAMVLPTPFESIHVYRFHAPTMLGFEGVPRDKTVRSRWGTFSVTCQALDDGDALRHLEVRFHTRIDQIRIEVADLDAFRKFHEEINREYRVWLTLRPVTDLDTADRLERWLALAPHDAQAARTLARIYLRVGRYVDAMRILNRAVSYHPDETDLAEMRVQAAVTPEEEERVQRDRLAQDRSSPKAILDLAAVLITRGNHAEARTLLAPLLTAKDATVRARAHVQMARSHYRKDELKEALAQLDAGTRADGATLDTLRTLILRGQVLDELKQPAQAIQAYTRALTKKPNDPEVLLSLVRLHLLAKDELAALDLLRRFTVQVSDDVANLLLAAETYYQMKRHDEALELALRARDKQFHERAQRLLGLIYLARKDFVRATQHLDRADPDALVLTGLLRASLATANLAVLEKAITRTERIEQPPARLAQALKQAREALRRREQLLKQKPPQVAESWSEAITWLACAETLASDAELRSAVEALLTRARPHLGSSGPLHALQARIFLQMGQPGQARQQATRAIELAPNDPAGYFARGLLRLEVEHPQALADLDRAAHLSQMKNPTILAALAEAQAQQGQLTQALQSVRQALVLTPGDPALVALLARLEGQVKKKAAG